MFLKAGGRDQDHSQVTETSRPMKASYVKNSDPDVTVLGTKCSDASLLVEAGIPGLQYSVVDSSLFQKMLVVVLVAPSGTDPNKPPSFSPLLLDDGFTLQVKVLISPVLFDPSLMTNENCSWMLKDGAYAQDAATRLSGLGPAVADLKKYLGESRTVTWKIPLKEKCSKVIDNYSISNFPSRSNPPFYPVMVEFKFTVKEMMSMCVLNVKKMT